jgi:hypothetical protein
VGSRPSGSGASGTPPAAASTGGSTPTPRIGPDPAFNFHFGAKGHTEVATSAGAFRPIFEFLAERAAEHPDVVPATTDDVTIAGRGLLFPQNQGYAGATVQVWPVDPATGQRTGAAPAASEVIDASGDFGPFTVRRGVHHELAIVRPDSPNVHHFFFEPFVRDDHFVRLLTSRPGEGIAAVIPTSPRRRTSSPSDARAVG